MTDDERELLLAVAELVRRMNIGNFGDQRLLAHFAERLLAVRMAKEKPPGPVYTETGGIDVIS